MKRQPFTRPSEARQIVRTVLEPRAELDRLADAELLASELATNALVHGRTQLPEIGVDGADGFARVEISDDDGATTPRPAVKDDPLTPGGHGLHIVDEVADRWGVQPEPPGKVVWFELDVSPPESTP